MVHFIDAIPVFAWKFFQINVKITPNLAVLTFNAYFREHY